jgi:hypothetical protein
MSINRLLGLTMTWGAVVLLCVALGCAPKAEKQAAPEPKGFGELGAAEGADRNATSVMPAEEYYIHTVQWPGESLSIIAKWYIGKLLDWELLAAHNPELDPNKIFVGNRIRIPESRMRTSEPMPREFVEQFLPPEPAEGEDRDMAGESASEQDGSEEDRPEKDMKQEEDREAGQEPEDELELFGPKGLDNS